MTSYTQNGHVSLDVTTPNFNTKLKGKHVASKASNQTPKNLARRRGISNVAQILEPLGKA